MEHMKYVEIICGIRVTRKGHTETVTFGSRPAEIMQASKRTRKKPGGFLGE